MRTIGRHQDFVAYSLEFFPCREETLLKRQRIRSFQHRTRCHMTLPCNPAGRPRRAAGKAIQIISRQILCLLILDQIPYNIPDIVLAALSEPVIDKPAFSGFLRREPNNLFFDKLSGRRKSIRVCFIEYAHISHIRPARFQVMRIQWRQNRLKLDSDSILHQQLCRSINPCKHAFSSAERFIGFVARAIERNADALRQPLFQPLHDFLVNQRSVGVNGNHKAHVIQRFVQLPKMRIE